jgi:hypothetical protein
MFPKKLNDSSVRGIPSRSPCVSFMEHPERMAAKETAKHENLTMERMSQRYKKTNGFDFI